MAAVMCGVLKNCIVIAALCHGLLVAEGGSERREPSSGAGVARLLEHSRSMNNVPPNTSAKYFILCRLELRTEADRIRVLKDAYSRMKSKGVELVLVDNDATEKSGMELLRKSKANFCPAVYVNERVVKSLWQGAHAGNSVVIKKEQGEVVAQGGYRLLQDWEEIVNEEKSMRGLKNVVLNVKPDWRRAKYFLVLRVNSSSPEGYREYIGLMPSLIKDHKALQDAGVELIIFDSGGSKESILETYRESKAKFPLVWDRYEVLRGNDLPLPILLGSNSVLFDADCNAIATGGASLAKDWRRAISGTLSDYSPKPAEKKPSPPPAPAKPTPAKPAEGAPAPPQPQQKSTTDEVLDWLKSGKKLIDNALGS